MSPAATQWLYPYPLYGESPNHSAVDFTQPDAVRHPLYAEALEHQLSAHLQVNTARSWLRAMQVMLGTTVLIGFLDVHRHRGVCNMSCCCMVSLYYVWSNTQCRKIHYVALVLHHGRKSHRCSLVHDRSIA